MKHKKLSFQTDFLEVKASDGKIRIKGLASTPSIDRYDDIVNPLAFMEAKDDYMKNPVILLQHNGDDVLGKCLEFNVLPQGLEIVAELSFNINETFEKITEGVLRGFSIGFIAKEWAYKEIEGRQVREITALDLVEISVVSTPANKDSLFTLTKALKKLFTEIKSEEDTKTTEEEETGKDVITPKQEEAPKVEESPKEEAPKTETLTTEAKDATEIDFSKSESVQGEQPAEAALKTDNQPTAEAAPAGETPATPEVATATVEDKSEVVKADEKPEEVAKTDEPQLTEEVQALKSSVAELQGKIEAIEAKHVEAERAIADANARAEKAEEKADKLEKYIDSFEVRSAGVSMETKTTAKQFVYKIGR